MKTKIYLFLFLSLSSTFIYAQSDAFMEKLKLMEMMDNYETSRNNRKNQDIRCKNNILDIYSGVSKEIIKYSKYLTEEQYTSLKKYQKSKWKYITSNIRQYNSYCKFWNAKLRTFRLYEEEMLEKLISKIR